MTKIKFYLLNFILSLLGFAMLTYFIWLRFLRERIPRDIPFNLTLFKFLVICYICFIYVYIIISLLYKNKTDSELISTIVSYIYKPLKTLDISIKTNPIIQPYYKKVLIYLINFISRIVNLQTGHSYLKLYILLQIAPRIILVSALLIDIFYFHCISLLYKIILIGLILVITRYIKYSFKYAQERYILELEYMVKYITTNYYDKEDPDDNPFFNNNLSVRHFIDVQASSLGNGLEGYSLFPFLSDEYRYDYYKRNNIPLIQNLTYEQREDIDKPFYLIMDIVIPLSVHIEEYYYAEVYSRSRYAKAIIFSLYLICWSYILIVSFHTLPPDTFVSLLEIINKENPFSVTTLEYYLSEENFLFKNP